MYCHAQETRELLGLAITGGKSRVMALAGSQHHVVFIQCDYAQSVVDLNNVFIPVRHLTGIVPEMDDNFLMIIMRKSGHPYYRQQYCRQ
jgi:hypothetical protein